jgi:hypothetical protein
MDHSPLSRRWGQALWSGGKASIITALKQGNLCSGAPILNAFRSNGFGALNIRLFSGLFLMEDGSD